MMPDCFLGIDTSNYTTSVALCTVSGEITQQFKLLLPVKDGACGLRQSDAVFAHVKHFPLLAQQLREALAGRSPLAVACSAFPRTAENSYMPCFLTGKAVASMLGASLNVPVYEFAHQEGHLMAALYSCGAAERLMKAPFAAFHVSGGTTEVLYVTPKACGFEVRLVGKTEDLNAGQAIDRAGVMMGLSFPCGKEMEQLALQCKEDIKGLKTCVRDGNCHLSGLQNIAERLWLETQDRAYVSKLVLAFIEKTLRQMTADLDARFGHLPIVYAGGVMSNRFLQQRLSERADTYFAEPQYSADNAAGIALLGRASYLAERADGTQMRTENSK